MASSSARSSHSSIPSLRRRRAPPTGRGSGSLQLPRGPRPRWATARRTKPRYRVATAFATPPSCSASGSISSSSAPCSTTPSTLRPRPVGRGRPGRRPFRRDPPVSLRRGYSRICGVTHYLTNGMSSRRQTSRQTASPRIAVTSPTHCRTVACVLHHPATTASGRHRKRLGLAKPGDRFPAELGE